jgi:C4-dicarboxylate transporter DctM subunit
VFTPTEAGGIVVVYSAILGLFVFKSLDLKGLMTSMMSSGRLTAGIFLIIACSQVLNYVLVLGGIDQAAGNIVRLFDGQTFLFLLFCAFLFVLIGLALDAGAALLLLAPIMLPIARSMGIDDLHFSMVMILSTTLGLISPPVGIVLFVSCKIGEMRIRDLWKELGPFFYLHLAFLVVLIAVPELSTFLPYYLRH